MRFDNVAFYFCFFPSNITKGLAEICHNVDFICSKIFAVAAASDVLKCALFNFDCNANHRLERNTLQQSFYITIQLRQCVHCLLAKRSQCASNMRELGNTNGNSSDFPKLTKFTRYNEFIHSVSVH